MTTHTQKHTHVSDSASTPVTQVQPPPTVKVPSPPDNYDPNASASYVAAQPKKAELATISSAVEELGKFADYAQVFGKTAPPVAHLVQTLQAAAGWSALLVASTLWVGYVRAGSAAAWQDARGLIEGLKAPFNLAVAQDPALASAFPALTRLLGVAKAISLKGASTRKANAKDVAEGKLPTHGKVGKKRKKEAAVASPAAAPIATRPTTPAAVPAAPVTATPAPAAPAVTNGAAQG
jgi:hypothetical protein